MIYATGGLDSPLSVLYLFVIIATSVMLPRAACYLIASGASIIYGLLVDLEYFHIIKPASLFVESHVSFASGYGFYIIALNIASYYSVAYLSSILSHRLRTVKEELAHTSTDLKKLQAFLQNVVHNMGNGLITTDMKGRVTSVNRAAEEIMGYSLKESLNNPLDILLSLPDLENLFRELDSQSFPKQIESECRRKDGTTIVVRMKISCLESQEESAKGFIFVFEDLTEIKTMQEKISQAEQLAAVGRFSAGLAHEIRNPLASISGSIQVISKGLQLDSRFRQLMEIVLRETDRLNAIVSDFLDYAQPGKGKKNTLVDITQIIQDTIILLKNSDDYRSSVEIEFAGHSGHLVLQGNEEEIKQLVWNLFINGLQSMSSKGGKLRISLVSTPTVARTGPFIDQKGIRLTVEDEGCGIPPKQLNKIFDPFYSTKENGVGLGLATVYQIVQRNGGMIDVSSRPEQGTSFFVFFPGEESATEEAANPPKRPLAVGAVKK
ncbi:MAG: PAS domain S-box protein [Nitrospinae bacterium]|nr:PAS domain S-box protein [Nitrospinota bacterium]